MGVLDDLKREAQSRKQNEEERETRQAQLQEIYRTEIRPVMRDVYTFLKELSDNLNYLRTDVRVSYALARFGRISGLKQSDYRVSVDSNEIKRIQLSFYCERERDFEFDAVGQVAIDKAKEYLNGTDLRHTGIPKRKGGQHAMVFIVSAAVPVALTVATEVETSSIRMTFRNFEALGVVSKQYRPEEVTAELLDEIGRAVMGKENTLFRERLPDVDRQRIREQLDAERALRDQELQRALELEAQEQAAGKPAVRKILDKIKASSPAVLRQLGIKKD